MSGLEDEEQVATIPDIGWMITLILSKKKTTGAWIDVLETKILWG